MRWRNRLVVMTTEKAVIIIVVTLIVIVLAYTFRFGMFSRPKQAGTGPDSGPHGPSGSV